MSHPQQPVDPSQPQAPQQQPAQAPLPQQPYQPPQAPQKKAITAMRQGVISIITGGVSLFLFPAILGTIGFIVGISAIVLSIKEMNAGAKNPAPLILGILGTIMGAVGVGGALLLQFAR